MDKPYPGDIFSNARRTDGAGSNAKSHSFHGVKFSKLIYATVLDSCSHTPYTYPFVNLFHFSRLVARHILRDTTRRVLASMCPHPGAGDADGKGVQEKIQLMSQPVRSGPVHFNRDWREDPPALDCTSFRVCFLRDYRGSERRGRRSAALSRPRAERPAAACQWPTSRQLVPST